MDREIRQRQVWVQLFEKTHNAGYVCRRCGISRPTLRKWVKRYQEYGVVGLETHSKCPLNSPNRKIFQIQKEWIAELRTKRRLGCRRIQHELERNHRYHLSLSSIQKVLIELQVKHLSNTRWRKKICRYEKGIPGERVQVDTIKISKGLYQYTAIDDCSRYILMVLFSDRTAENTLEFLEMVKDGLPFPVQRVQTDRGTEFTAYDVRDALLSWRIKWRPNRPGAPHLNGKVERVQKTVIEEFYSISDLNSPNLEFDLSQWQWYYNHDRIHGTLGKTPMERVLELQDKIPASQDVCLNFNEAYELKRMRFFGVDTILNKVKQSL